MAPSVLVRPGTLADAETLIRVGYAAYRDDHITHAKFPEHLRRKYGMTEEMAWRLRTMKRALAAEDGDQAEKKKKTAHVVVAVLRSGEGDDEREDVAGWAIWREPAQPNAKPGASAPEKEKKDEDELPPSMDKEVAARFDAAMVALARRHLGETYDQEYWMLQVLAVDPKFHRRGVGKALVQWGVEHAFRAGRDVQLTASPAGRLLYLSQGFEVVAEETHHGAVCSLMVKRRKRDGD
ncbi:hypothetical protein VTK73DRAFT_688 [Phialemonium thermophilum]|uniref:N-acetyltransferase domain-containing protein n=1 Tax=Phialemonium thermophilum TaxID=223376 RepID=A0ABR3VUI2_9PEZI